MITRVGFKETRLPGGSFRYSQWAVFAESLVQCQDLIFG